MAKYVNQDFSNDADIYVYCKINRTQCNALYYKLECDMVEWTEYLVIPTGPGFNGFWQHDLRYSMYSL